METYNIMERHNIKEMESKIFDETKALGEIETKLRKAETTIMKERFWNEFDEQQTLERQKIKMEAEN